MPPKKVVPQTQQQTQQSQNRSRTGTTHKSQSSTGKNDSAIPEREIKKNSAISAQFALEAAKKAYELRQAAYGAGDPNAREEILAKAINKEIEAESFGKAAKYTRSGAFQGLAAGAGMGVQPGVTLGKLTGALVGGLLSSVGAVLGGGIGSVYGALNGPFWDLGQIASQGVRSIVGDFPNWEATSGQKQALEKMVMGAQQTKAPNQKELEQMKEDNGGLSQEEYQGIANSLTSWIPNMPSMPSMPTLPNMPSIPSIPSLPGLWGPAQPSNQTSSTKSAKPIAKSDQSQQPKTPAKPPAKPPAKLQVKPKPQDPSSKASNQATKSQDLSTPHQSMARSKPKKLEVRSKGTTS